MLRRAKIATGVILLFVIAILGGCSMQNKPANGTAVKYPAKPITVMVPYSAGGMTDIMTRAMEKFAVKYFEQPFIIVNKPGGAGTIAWNELIKDKPDGYVVGVMTYSAILQPIYGQSKYNYSTALDPIAQFANPPMVLSVLPNSKYKTLEELVRYAKDHPGEVKFGHGGLGAGSHVLVEMFAKEADIKIEQVPFQGSAESIAALLGGHIDMIVSGTPELREYIKSNQIKPIAVTGSHRLNDPGFTDVLTFKEQGFNDAINNFHCIVAPKEIPLEIKSKLVLCFKNIINDPEYQAAMRELGVETEYMGPEDCIKAWAFDSQLLTKVVHETGVFEKIAAQKK
jgi:tripartite-type tricarboxylate transporter receptor subunit TctC